MAQTDIKINPTKPSNLEFSITISGLDNVDLKVRFVLCDMYGGIDWVIGCSHVNGDKWSVAIPILKGLTKNNTTFRVEVIADEYFFTPARGNITFVTVKDVEFNPKSQKPSVKADFSQLINPVKETFAAGSGDSSPTTILLTPEPNGSIPDEEIHNPGMYDVIPDEEPDENIEQSSISITVLDNPDGIDISDEFNAQDIASTIIKKTVGQMKRPGKRGSLFNRAPDGSAIVAGMNNPSHQQDLETKANKVKNILRDIN